MAPQSSDLNSIKTLWLTLDLNSNDEKKNITNSKDIVTHLSTTWNSIDKNAHKTLVKSMIERCKTVIEAEGYCTKF